MIKHLDALESELSLSKQCNHVRWTSYYSRNIVCSSTFQNGVGEVGDTIDEVGEPLFTAVAKFLGCKGESNSGGNGIVGWKRMWSRHISCLYGCAFGDR